MPLYLLFILSLFSWVGGDLLGKGEDLLIIGYTNTFYGSTLPQGFVNIIRGEMPNKQIHTVAVPYSDTQIISNMLQHEEHSDKKIEKAFYIIEADAILSHYVKQQDVDHLSVPVTYPNPIITEIEFVLSFLRSRQIDTSLCVMLLAGEGSAENQLELHFEEWRALLRHISISYDVKFIDTTLPFSKYNEEVNIDDIEHSTLTHDGNVLNERGHMLFAHELLSTLGVASLIKAVDKSKWDMLNRKTHREDIDRLRMKYATS